MRDKVIRPSLVNVAVNTTDTEEHKETAPAIDEPAATGAQPSKEKAVHRKDIASATAELPALDAFTTAGELHLRSSHSQNAEDDNLEADKGDSTGGTHPKADAHEHHKGAHKRKHADKSEASAEEKKDELAEISASTDRQGSDE